MNSKRFIAHLFLPIIVLFFGFSSAVFAAPTIDTFVVTPTSMPSGQLVSLSWSGHDVSGYNLFVTCSQGIKIKNTSGSPITCGVKTATTPAVADSLGLFLVNTSGSSKSVTFRLYPKSAAGDENSSGVMEQTVYINPIPYPINSFYASATSTSSGKSTTLSWSTLSDLDGVNMTLSCADGVTATTSTYTGNVPCGTFAFTNKLTSSGSVTLSFKNTNANNVPVVVNLIPSIDDTSYDLTHAQTILLDISTDKSLPSQITNFSFSKNNIVSGDSVNLSWNVNNTTGINLKMGCDSSITAAIVNGSTTQPIFCDRLIFDQPLSSNASTSIIISSVARDTHSIPLTILPQFQGGGFDGVNTRTVSILVAPKGQVVTQGTVQILGIATTTSTALGLVINHPRKKFIKTLSVGSRSDDVSALQEFLSKNGYYPEGLVTGYFGPATQKAVGRFQEFYKIAKSGGAGYGSAGPATRAKLNSL